MNKNRIVFLFFIIFFGLVSSVFCEPPSAQRVSQGSVSETDDRWLLATGTLNLGASTTITLPDGQNTFMLYASNTKLLIYFSKWNYRKGEIVTPIQWKVVQEVPGGCTFTWHIETPGGTKVNIRSPVGSGHYNFFSSTRIGYRNPVAGLWDKPWWFW